MRLGTTSLSVTKPGSVRKYAAAAAVAANFKDIDQYSHVRFKKFVDTTEACIACEVHPNGSKFWVLQGNYHSGRFLREFSLSTNFDISTAGSSALSSFNTKTYNGNSAITFRFKPDGTKLFTAEYNGGITSFDLSTPWDISTISHNNDLTDITGFQTADILWDPTGKYLFFCDPHNDRVFRKEYATAWDHSSTEVEHTYSVLLDLSTTANVIASRSIQFNEDGTKIYIADQSADKVVMYNLNTAYDITSTSLSGTPDSTLSLSGIETEALGMAFDPTGEHLYISGNQGDGVDQFVRS